MTPTDSKPGGKTDVIESLHERAAEQSPDLLWISAALMETLVLVGGMLWITNGPGSIALSARILVVALFAVISGGVFALLAVQRGRTNR